MRAFVATVIIGILVAKEPVLCMEAMNHVIYACMHAVALVVSIFKVMLSLMQAIMYVLTMFDKKALFENQVVVITGEPFAAVW